MQPTPGSHWSEVQSSASSQLGAVPATHAPCWQVSVPSQTSASAQPVPSATGTFKQPPVVASQESTVQGLLSSQLSAGPRRHTPVWQVSLPLHTLPSEQLAPSESLRFLQPVAGLHVSAVHGSVSLQFGGVPRAHTPAWQVSGPL